MENCQKHKNRLNFENCLSQENRKNYKKLGIYLNSMLKKTSQVF